MKKRYPNILFFFTDDQRFDTIGALGNPNIHTPHLDWLVQRGCSFTHAHIPGGTCGAVCMPSRAMLHTGRTLFHIDGEGQQIPTEHTTIGECLRKSGYQTYGIGKWHNGRESYARSFSGGDEIFFGGMGDHWNVPAYHFDPSGQYTSRCPICPDPSYSNEVHLRECDHIEAGKHSTELFADTAISFIREYSAENPFFLYVSLMAPHDPRTMPEKFRKMYNPAKIKLPENFAEEHDIDTGALKIRDELLAEFPRDPDEIRRHIAEYYAMISHLDDAFGRIIDSLKERDLFEDTIIVVAGDNGLAVGQHGLMGKQNLYEHSVRVPLIFAGPGIPAGVQSDALTYLLDIFPTLCDLNDIEIPDSVEGMSLVPCMHGSANARDSLYLVYGDSIRGVTNGSYKLIEYACGETQLFDIKNDPYELQNLAEDQASQEMLKSMRTELLKFAAKWNDKDHSTVRIFWNKRADINP
jgi:arylsulfatase A-like enzyme